MAGGPKVIGSAQCANPFVTELEVRAVVRPASAAIPDKQGHQPDDLEWIPTYSHVIDYGVIAHSKFGIFNRLGKFAKRTWQESEAVVRRKLGLE
jgi:hypothetical protein